MNISLTSILVFITEIFCIIILFKDLPQFTGKRRVLGYLSLLPLVFLYFTYSQGTSPSTINILTLFSRTFFHCLGVFLFLFLAKDISIKKVWLFVAVDLTINLAAQNISLVPTSFPSLGNVSNMIHIACRLFLTYIMYYNLKFSKLKEVNNNYLIICYVGGFLEYYFKWSLMSKRTTELASRLDYFLYSLAGIIGTYLVCLLLLVSEIYREEKNLIEKENIERAYQVSNAKKALVYESDIKRLHHDMKNHLIMIKSLAKDNDKLDNYLKSIMTQMNGYDSQISTGNAIVDSLLSAKIVTGKTFNTSFNICLDLTKLKYLEETDVVSIFGNAIDNSLEACKQLDDCDERLIFIKSKEYAQNILVTFVNKYKGNIDSLKTSKPDKKNHGIGLNSIKHSVERYGGTISTNIDNENKQFSLTIILPIDN